MSEVVGTNQFRNGMHIKVDGTTWRIMEHQHHKPGKGAAVMRTKLRNAETGAIVDRTFRTGEKFPRLQAETRNAQYLYADGDLLVFMDQETFDQVTVDRSRIGDESRFLSDGMSVQLLLLDGEPAGVQLPTTVELEVVETEPAVRGDTVGNVQKPATLAGGVVVQVPAFINVGDVLQVDTRDGSYLGRA